MSTLFEDFMSSKGQWRNSIIIKTVKNKRRNGKRGVRKWLTETQLMQIFTNRQVVLAIINRKKADPELAATEIREHPECPGHPSCNMVPCM